MKGYRTVLPLDEDNGVRLFYLNGGMSLTIMDYGRRKSTTFYRRGDDEERLRRELFQVSGVKMLIEKNRQKIEEQLRTGGLGTHKPFREFWELVA